MGRLYNRIWRDQDYLSLSIGAKLLFALLLSQDNISPAGVLPLQPRLWAELVGDGATANDVVAWLNELQGMPSRPFVLIDADTEEVLVRTLIRNDKMPQGTPKVQAPAIEACAVVRSVVLRDWLAGELEKCICAGLVHGTLQEKTFEMVDVLSPDRHSDSQSDSNSDRQGEWLSRGSGLSSSPSPSPSKARANENGDRSTVVVDTEPSEDRPYGSCDRCGGDRDENGECCDPQCVPLPACRYEAKDRQRCIKPATKDDLCAHHWAINNWRTGT
ncbi:hypothetical protein A5714_01950 [Mycobacterium sp. E2462]|uniref:hypothetical protein n=1 Tax=Mycobacterium sp. E2462 TaxID=1834133 RepID=UPI0007FD4396|nr:hypothetical protein [Mycobacterium sp. E2462]OBI08557.1 hypothetical protein A5714_01950 [Mycobacterium sp. E2462]